MRRSTLLRNAAFMRQRRIVSCAPLPRTDTNEHELKRVVARIARIDANGTLFAAIREIRIALLCTKVFAACANSSQRAFSSSPRDAGVERGPRRGASTHTMYLLSSAL